MKRVRCGGKSKTTKSEQALDHEEKNSENLPNEICSAALGDGIWSQISQMDRIFFFFFDGAKILHKKATGVDSAQLHFLPSY